MENTVMLLCKWCWFIEWMTPSKTGYYRFTRSSEWGKKNDQAPGKTLIWGQIEKTGIATFERRWITKNMIRF